MKGRTLEGGGRRVKGKVEPAALAVGGGHPFHGEFHQFFGVLEAELFLDVRTVGFDLTLS